MIIIQGREIEAVAVDFDGTLFVEEYPGIGDPIWKTINYVKFLKSQGISLILYTNREGQLLEDALEACKSVGIEFDAVNENLQERIIKWGPSRKIGADLYIDDKSMNPTLEETFYHKIISNESYRNAMMNNPYFKCIVDEILFGNMNTEQAIYYLCEQLQGSTK